MQKAFLSDEQWAVWMKPLADGGIAVALLNRDDQPAKIAALWKNLGMTTGTSLAARYLWAHKKLGTCSDSLILSVVPHAAVLLKLSPFGRVARIGSSAFLIHSRPFGSIRPTFDF